MPPPARVHSCCLGVPSVVLLRHSATGIRSLFESDSAVEQMMARMIATTGRRPNAAEVRSWNASVPVLVNDLISGGLPLVEMLVEHQLPLTSKRVDVVLAGQHPRSGRASYVVVELKQWSRATQYRGVGVPGPRRCLRASAGAPSDGTGRDVSGLHARLPARAGRTVTRTWWRWRTCTTRRRRGSRNCAPIAIRVGADVHRRAPRRVPGLPAIATGPGRRGGRGGRPSAVAARRTEPATTDRRGAGDPRPGAVRPARRAATGVRHRSPRGANVPGRRTPRPW